ncbi:MAG: FAD-dependent oxidoreductase [Rhodospirillaceae bacterium]
MTSSAPPKIAIIGAGVAGLSCAQVLTQHGYRPIVFEKSRGTGGRMATRRISDGLTFDHGAQFVTARTAAFRAVLEKAHATGTLVPWVPTVLDDRPGVKAPPPSAERPWYVGTPGMNALAKALAGKLAVQFSTRVMALERGTNGWRLQTSFDPKGELFDYVVCTVPAPQARAMLHRDSQTAQQLKHVTMAPCWTLMLSLASPLTDRFDAWRSEQGEIGWAACNASKAGRTGDRTSWVIQMDSAWSEAHIELDEDDVSKKILALLADIIGHPIPDIEFATAHRWRYAHTRTPLGKPFAQDTNTSLFLGGDWALGNSVEYAFESGQAMGQALVDRLQA